MFVEARTHAFRDFALEAERREHVLVEPPQVDAEQNDFRRPRRRKQQAEIARVVQTVQHPARVVKGIRPCPEHRRPKFHRPGGSGHENGRVLLEDAAVFVGIERLVDAAQVQRIGMAALKREHAIGGPHFTGPLQHRFAEQKQQTWKSGKGQEVGQKSLQSVPSPRPGNRDRGNGPDH